MMFAQRSPASTLREERHNIAKSSNPWWYMSSWQSGSFFKAMNGGYDSDDPGNQGEHLGNLE